MQHGHVQAASTCSCCMSMSKLQVHVHDACPCPCCMSMFVLHVQLDAEHGQDTNMDTDMVINLDMDTDIDKYMDWRWPRAAARRISGVLLVCYHCGGWSEEVNSCILISYMVYLYQQHSYPAIIIMHIYNWYHSITTGILYVYKHRLHEFRLIPLLLAFLCSLLLPFVPPLLAWNPLCCDRIRPPRTQVARKLTSHFPPLAHIPLIPKSRPPGVSQP
jgi:hypothetical protein